VVDVDRIRYLLEESCRRLSSNDKIVVEISRTRRKVVKGEQVLLSGWEIVLKKLSSSNNVSVVFWSKKLDKRFLTDVRFWVLLYNKGTGKAIRGGLSKG